VIGRPYGPRLYAGRALRWQSIPDPLELAAWGVVVFVIGFAACGVLL
jgi:hypothetical protein